MDTVASHKLSSEESPAERSVANENSPDELSVHGTQDIRREHDIQCIFLSESMNFLPVKNLSIIKRWSWYR